MKFGQETQKPLFDRVDNTIEMMEDRKGKLVPVRIVRFTKADVAAMGKHTISHFFRLLVAAGFDLHDEEHEVKTKYDSMKQQYTYWQECEPNKVVVVTMPKKGVKPRRLITFEEDD